MEMVKAMTEEVVAQLAKQVGDVDLSLPESRAFIQRVIDSNEGELKNQQILFEYHRRMRDDARMLQTAAEVKHMRDGLKTLRGMLQPEN